MTDLIATNNQLTMSSREIAELTGKRHDHVLRDIRAMFADLDLSPNFGEKVEATGGRPSTVYHLDRDLTDCLLTGYSAKARMRVIKRWRQLEQESAPELPDFSDPVASARAWADAKEAEQAALTHAEQLREETRRLNSVCNDLAANLKSGITPPAFCRMLNGVNINRVQPLLVERKRLIKTAHGYRSASAYRDKLFTERRELNQEGRLCEKVVLTLKGAKWLYAEYEKGHLEMKRDWDGQYSHLILEQEAAA
jgi:phage regulator Rha-like protein